MSMGYLDIAHKNKPRNSKDIHVSLCFFGLILSPTIINLSSTGCQKKNVGFGNTKKQGLLGQAKFEKINNKHACPSPIRNHEKHKFDLGRHHSKTPSTRDPLRSVKVAIGKLMAYKIPVDSGCKVVKRTWDRITKESTAKTQIRGLWICTKFTDLNKDIPKCSSYGIFTYTSP